jgi:hypothetical protein
MEVYTTNKGMIILEITPRKMARQLVCGVKDASASSDNGRLTIALHSTTNQIVE